jgi:deoxyribodipyrimidine photo-lyase
MKRAIVWFTTDLRLHDNETLLKAIEENDEVLPVYCIDPRYFETTKAGFKKTGKFRAQFLLESLKDLDQGLRERGSGLMLLNGRPECLLDELCKEYKVEKIYTKQEIAWDELQMQNATEKSLSNCELIKVENSFLYHKNDLNFVHGKLPSVFTEYRKQLEKNAKVRDLFICPDKINSPNIEEVIWPKVEDLGLSSIVKDPRAAYDFLGGEVAAMKRLNTYLFETHCISKYKETRNGLIGENYSSKFSAALAMGCLSAKYIYHSIKLYEAQFGGNDSTYWLVFELLWRDYFRLMMEKYPKQFFLKNGIQKLHNLNFKHSESDFENWKQGKTKDDFVNANMIELRNTGFMSNRGRQNVASYLCHDLKLDWRMGAAYFEEILIDYDVSSNWCNWAYIAGVGNDPRNGRAFNLEKQAKTYDPESKYRRLWLGNDF